MLYRDTIHLLSNHKYLTNRTVDFDENNLAACRCTFAQLADQILTRVAADYGEIRLDKVSVADPNFFHPEST
jgi:hypothetical protein